MNIVYNHGAMSLDPFGKSVTWRRARPEYFTRYMPAICIVQQSISEDGCFIPAISLVVEGHEELFILRAAIDEALKNGEGEQT